MRIEPPVILNFLGRRSLLDINLLCIQFRVIFETKSLFLLGMASLPFLVSFSVRLSVEKICVDPHQSLSSPFSFSWSTFTVVVVFSSPPTRLFLIFREKGGENG